MRRVEAARDLMLPSTSAEEKMMSGMDTPVMEPPPVVSTAMGTATVYGRPRGASVASQRSPLHHLQHPPYPTILPPIPKAHNHNHPNLHTKLPPPPTTILIPKRGTFSPLDSYPSPPPSIDESPLSSPPLPHIHSLPFPEARVPLTRVSA
jgi:solute carrier family 35 protein E1